MPKVFKIFCFFIFSFLFLTQAHFINATDNKFATIINPVRGGDFWSLIDQKPEDFIIFNRNEIDNQIKKTWLLRPDFYINNQANIYNYKKQINNNDETGIFLEVTPTWANLAGVEYNSKLSWHDPRNVFLSGYNPKDREKLIDSALYQFKQNFGFYPKTVGAWNIDSYSANYLSDKYQVKVFLICSDQTSTDGYQIWGGWWGVPYFPSKQNLLMPAQTVEDKLNTVVLWWAARDPVNAYGSGVDKSTYSVQPNDYMLHNLKTDYFEKLTNIYLNPSLGEFGQLTIGLENDYSINKYGNEYKNQINFLQKQPIQFLTASEFYQWYKKYNLSPNHEISGVDPLNSNQEFKWIMEKDKRTGLIKENSNWVVKDYRTYPKFLPDPYYLTKNLAPSLYWNIPAQTDAVLTTNFSPVKSLQNNLIQNIFIIFLIFLVFSVLSIKFKIPIIFSLFILLSTLLIAMTTIKSGWLYNYGIGFWGPNGHDSIWHLSLINQLISNIPPNNPVFSGSILQNYHWGFDLFTAIIVKITHLNLLDVYFRFLPITFGLLIGFLSYKFAFIITKNKFSSFFFVLLNYFAGSFGWIITLIKDKNIGGESLFWSMQSASTLLNPPYALSIIIILSGLILWNQKRNKNWRWGIIIGLILGLLAGIKIYAGLICLFAFCCLWFLKFIFTKKTTKFDLSLCITLGLTSLLIMFALGVFSGSSSLQFKPLWFTHSLVESIDKLYLPKIASYRINLTQNLFSIKFPLLIIIECFLIGIFLVGNMGTRIFGFFVILKKVLTKKIEDIDKLFLLMMLFAFLMPLIFVQKGTAWNTIQFFYFFLFLANFYFAIFLGNLWNKRKILTILLILLTVPTTYSTLKDYFGFPPPSTLPIYEVQTLNYLKNQKNGFVLTYPYDKFKKDEVSTPIPLYLYETTAYVSAFSNKSTYLEDEMNLDITGYDWQKRKSDVQKFFSTTDKFFARGFLLNNKIDYIYLVNDQSIKLQDNDLDIVKIFDNGQCKIYKVKK